MVFIGVFRFGCTPPLITACITLWHYSETIALHSLTNKLAVKTFLIEECVVPSYEIVMNMQDLT